MPMVDQENKLNLLQFIPFPLSQSLGANTSKHHCNTKSQQRSHRCRKGPPIQNLGSNGSNGMHKTGPKLSLQRKKRVKRTDIKDSCFRALYSHNLPGVLKHCQLQPGETREMVFQIGPNQWLVSAPEKFASVMQCEKSHETIIVNLISTVTVKPGYKLQLKAYLIQPDTNQ
jgi:hypothetical protein